MPKLFVFNNVSLDGFFVDATGDLSWAKSSEDAEFSAFIADNAKSGGVLVFGRKTYEMMAAYWPTPQAAKSDPVLAKRMNGFSKVVFSRTLDAVHWSNTRLVKRGLAAEVRRMKKGPGNDMVILGSGSIVSQLAGEGLVDEFQVVVIPVILGGGRTMFEGVGKTLPLELKRTRTFKNGNVFMAYGPAP